jgi:uncharacterized spore protein YtfJ
MDVQELMSGMRDTLTVKRVFGEPYERDGVSVIPVAKVSGGGGGGQGNGPEESTGEGGGFGMSAKPAGVYVVANGKVRWEPAVDITKIVVGAQMLAFLALLTIRGVLKARRR